MNYFGKTIILSLVVALVSFAGSFCMHPMMARAASVDTTAGVAQDYSGTNDGGCVTAPSDEISNNVTCTSDCVTTIPQTIVTKKVSVDSAQNFIVASQGEQSVHFSKLFFGGAGFSETPPPAPDILSSVVKIE